MSEHPADLPLFSRTEVAKFLGLPYRRVVRAFAKRGQQYRTLTLQNVYDSGLEGGGEWLYGRDGPRAYRPVPGVLVDPRVQFGRPCLEGTGIKTAVVASRLSAGEPVSSLFHDYDIDEALVRAAVGFEGGYRLRAETPEERRAEVLAKASIDRR